LFEPAQLSYTRSGAKVKGLDKTVNHFFTSNLSAFRRLVLAAPDIALAFLWVGIGRPAIFRPPLSRKKLCHKKLAAPTSLGVG
jgi:hypothetical protein